MALQTPKTRVMHRHHVGRQHDGDKRIPAVFVELDGALLRRSPKRNLYLYDGVTSDPRF